MHKLFKKLFYKKSAWQIGIAYSDQKALNEIVVPAAATISKCDIIDIDASFVADPFLLHVDNLWYCFFEIKDREKNRGVIGASCSKDLQNWDYLGVVLQEDYHLSYPHVFTYDDAVYMIPEGGEDKSVKLYKASSFPMQWKYERTLLEGEDFRDTTLLIHEDVFYFFTSLNGDDNLHLYTADTLEDKLIPHPKNPLVTNNPKISRNGGNIFFYDNHIYRFAQDCSRRYGESLQWMEITKLSKTAFEQKHLGTFLQGDQATNWHSRKVHHFSAQIHLGKLFYAVDGEGWGN